MKRSLALFLILVSATASAAPALAQQPTPVMEFASVLSGLRVRHATGSIEFEGPNHSLATVFLPRGASLVATVTKKNSTKVLVQQQFAVANPKGAFNRVSPGGQLNQFQFTEPGDYVLRYFANGKVISQLPFNVEFVTKDDVFDPKTFIYLNGPWSKWAYLYAPLPGASSSDLEFRMWANKQSFLEAPDADKYDVEIRLNGDVVSVASTGLVSTHEGRQLRFVLRHPKSKGGRTMREAELVSRDGTYHVIVKKNGELFAAWPFAVKGGKPELHARQASDFSPRTDYIVPRVSGISNHSPGKVVFMERLSDSAATAVLTGRATEVAGPTDADRKRWEWIPRSIDPKRPFRLTVSDIETRSDTGFAVGEDMIVFGTAYPNGVKYMKAGDTQAREIPGGETFSSTVFSVAGKKIVLTKRNHVAIFDTETEKLTALPETDISIYSPSNSLINANGFLVATVNKAMTVKDRTIVKVIDISGESPVVIPIKNSNYTDRDVTSVSVDAKRGHIAIASRAKKFISAAKVAPGANQHVFDVSEYRGVSSFKITLENEVVTYADEDWNVRTLKLDEGMPKAMTQESIARSGNGFWVRRGRLAVVTKAERVGSRYRIAVTDSKDTPQTISGTGTAIKGTSASLGMGGSVAIAIDKTVFLAGTPRDSIGTGERLQMLNGDGPWMPILGNDGKPIWGSQVVTSMGFMALKVRNAVGKTVVGYATYGERIDGSAVNRSTRNVASSDRSPAKTTDSKSESTVDYGPKDDEIKNAFLKATLDAEQKIYKALANVFGDKEARKRATEGSLKALTKSGHKDWIEDYKQQSTLFKK